MTVPLELLLAPTPFEFYYEAFPSLVETVLEEAGSVLKTVTSQREYIIHQ